MAVAEVFAGLGSVWSLGGKGEGSLLQNKFLLGKYKHLGVDRIEDAGL